MARLGCRRPLYTQDMAEDFVEKAFDSPDDAEKIAHAIVEAELALDKLEKSPTFTHQQYREKSIGRNKNGKNYVVLS